MCGIAGVWSKEPVAPEIVEKMLAEIVYRGPDHTEVCTYQSENGLHLTVGQNRLAIIDLRPEANQPFEDKQGKTSLTFNGEFYNFEDLRAELEAQGYSFRTRSDTEVALHALDCWGTEALQRLWGMFAGAWFHRKNGRLTLFRDRNGKKPLYLYPHAGKLYFASEPKAILAVLDHIPEPDPDAVAHFFYLGYVPTDRCIYKGMFKIPAGHMLVSNDPQHWVLSRWYRPETETPAAETELEELFMDAVAKRMIADVPLAAFLSGGLDSSLVVAAMSRIAPGKVNTFSVRFSGPQVLDESPYAKLVAETCKTHHHEVVFGIDSLRDAFPEVLDHFDEPFGDASAVPMFIVSKAARKQFTVALSGDGADEIFAGYRKYLGPHYLRKLGPYPLRRLLRPLIQLLPTGRTNARLEAGRRMRRLLRGDAPSAAERHIRWMNMNPVDNNPLMGPMTGSIDAVRSRLTALLPAHAELNHVLRFDQDLVLQDDMFVKVDRMSMKASLEVRSPFVDHRLVQLANALPGERKLHGTTRKRVLLERLGHLLPKDILERPKTGFEMPTGAWLRGEMRTWAEERLLHYADTKHWVNQDALRHLWQTHLSGKLDCTEPLWFHIAFASWLKRTYG